MAERIISMRTLLRQNLEALGSPLRWGVLPPMLPMPAGLPDASADLHARLVECTQFSPCSAALPCCSWNHITDQIGMFCYTGLTPEQVGSDGCYAVA